MFFVVDKPRLRRIIAIVREDRSPARDAEIPFLRLKAENTELTISGGGCVSATFPATVYEAGVLFIKTTIYFANNYIPTMSGKTRKSMGSRPVPIQVMTELRKFVNGSSTEQVKLFNNNFSHKRWEKMCEVAGLSDLKFHDLRKTFGSLLAQNGVSTVVTQKLL